MATFTRRDLTLRGVVAVRILGVDPGTQCVGYACLELPVARPVRGVGEIPLALRASNTVQVGAVGGEVRLVGFGALRLGGRSTPLPRRLLSLVEQFRDLVGRFSPHEVALEEAFYGKSVQAALRIGEARGVILAESARSGLEVHQFSPARVKRCVTGRGNASKEAVAELVARQVDLGDAPASRSRDATDAIGIALTRVEQRRSPMLGLLDG
ncbi:MAG: crossover junction endodeoxyribonuclease RuvC [Planctomycetes bacterium]|nr:crossover junction endodeoxyribonuclease RuvC [Planctomycetota bacterium]